VCEKYAEPKEKRFRNNRQKGQGVGTLTFYQKMRPENAGVAMSRFLKRRGRTTIFEGAHLFLEMRKKESCDLFPFDFGKHRSQAV